MIPVTVQAVRTPAKICPAAILSKGESGAQSEDQSDILKHKVRRSKEGLHWSSGIESDEEPNPKDTKAGGATGRRTTPNKGGRGGERFPQFQYW